MKDSTTPQRTPLYQSHVEAGGKLVDFSGWEMPVNYGSQIQEHHAVRTGCGVFDVSHMTIIDFTGPGCKEFLSRLLANDIGKASSPGKAIYTCMLNDTGGIIDDLIAYNLAENQYRLVVNAGTRDKDIKWLKQHLPENVSMQEKTELAMLAVQGPAATEKLGSIPKIARSEILAQLKRFSAVNADEWFVARTGYTGEDGFEIALPAADAVVLWNDLVACGVVPCGLGARDTLRLEAGLNLYGSDMSEDVSPLESGIEWTVSWEPRDFIGRAALVAQREAGTYRVMKGLVLESRGVLRGHQPIIQGGIEMGEVTSGTFSPTLQKSVALARVEPALTGECEVLIRDKKLPARVVSVPFVRNGQAAFQAA